MVPLPTGRDVLAFFSDVATVFPDDQELAVPAVHAAAVAKLVKAYTRGVGFSGDGSTCEEDIAAVIVSASARSFANPTAVISEELGAFRSQPGVFNGWTLPELAVLHRYRRRLA